VETFVPRDVLGTNVYNPLRDFVQIVEMTDAKHRHKLLGIVERIINCHVASSSPPAPQSTPPRV
jgi:hypothetical protein